MAGDGRVGLGEDTAVWWRTLWHGLLADIRQAGGRGELIGETSTLESFRVVDHGCGDPADSGDVAGSDDHDSIGSAGWSRGGEIERVAKVTTTE